MSKDKQQRLPEAPNAAPVARLAVSIHRGRDGNYVVEDLRLEGDRVAKAEVLVSKDQFRVACGTMLLTLEERLKEWQREGVLK